MPAPVRPSAAIRTAYQKRLESVVDEMHRSINYWLTAEYRKALPLATDASPAMALRAAMRKMGNRWLRKFDQLAPALSAWFATDVQDRCDRTLKDIFRRHNFTVRFKPTRAMNEAYQAVIGENVSLITSLPQQYLKNVEGIVMRSVQTGRDLGALSKALEQNYGVTRRRAALIARTQNNMATATMTRTRQLESGITQARWLHSAGGKTPRPEHVAFSGKLYDIQEGAPIEGKWPGVAINCRCVSIPVIPGFD
jgi:SPP1 gp7 family putative phage head morphogenesis protein